jgi:transposase-like protein
MSTSTKKNVVRGKRYTSEEKNKVVSFVADYNAKNGRGGQSAAAKKFGISQLTIATWLKNAGLKSGGKVSGGSTGSMQKKLSTMLSLGQEIEKIERELKAKRSQFDSLKSSL